MICLSQQTIIMDSDRILKAAVYSLGCVLIFLCLLAFITHYCIRRVELPIRRYRRSGRGYPHRYNPAFRDNHFPQMERIDENV